MSDFFDIISGLPAEFDQPGSITPTPFIPVQGAASFQNVSTLFGQQRRDNLREYLRSLFQNVQLPPSLADWALDVIIEGASGAELSQRLYMRPEFRERFRAIFEIQKRGGPAISPQDVLAYERDGTALMRGANMPPSFYDQSDDFVDLMVNRVSMVQLAERVNEGYVMVASGPRGVREAFTDFFGPSGDAALAAYYLDPTRAEVALRQQLGAAQIAGAGFNFGFNLSRDKAMEAATQGYNFESATAQFTNLLQARPLFDETISERKDLRAEEEGVQAVFALSGGGQAATDIERRRQERTASFGGGGGAQGSLAEGARGLRSAE